MNHPSFVTFCRMKPSMDTTTMSNSCVLMSHLQICQITFLKDPLTSFSQIGYLCISQTLRSVLFAKVSSSCFQYRPALLNLRFCFSLPLMLQVQKLAERMLRWLKDAGYIFFRESCFHQSGDSKRKYNPTHYREPRFYTKVCSLKCSYNLTSLP